MSKLLVLIATLNMVVNQLLLKRSLQGITSPSSLTDARRFLFEVAHSPWLYIALTMQVLGYLLWLVVISKQKLGVAFALSGSLFYLLISFTAWLLYDERLSASQWVGIVLVTVGVVFLSIDKTAG